jgi:LAO/AO transport system kinase
LNASAGVDISGLAESVRQGESKAIARAISLVENGEPEAIPLIQSLFPHTGNAYLIGLTGAPGTGKSSLTNCLANHFREQGKKVGVLAIDPSSPFSGGALLGDRIRMQERSTDDGLYIRSMATRGALGGLARAAGDAALVLDAAGMDVVLIETVGVGQDEVDIIRLADVTLLLLVAGLGDDVQSFKAGVMEIADIFVINKADRGDTDRLEQEVQAMLGLVEQSGPWTPPIVKTSARDVTGIDEMAVVLGRFREMLLSSGTETEKRAARWRSRLLDLIRQRALERVMQGGVSEEQLAEVAGQIARRERDPYSVVEELLRSVGLQ